MELLETLRLFLQCCNSDQRLRSRLSLRSRPLPQKKSILGPILSFVLDIENLQHNFSCLKRHFHFLGLTASLGLNVQPRPPASAGQPSDLGWQLSDLGNKSSSCGMKSWASVFPTPGHSHSCPRELLFPTLVILEMVICLIILSENPWRKPFLYWNLDFHYYWNEKSDLKGLFLSPNVVRG